MTSRTQETHAGYGVRGMGGECISQVEFGGSNWVISFPSFRLNLPYKVHFTRLLTSIRSQRAIESI